MKSNKHRTIVLSSPEEKDFEMQLVECLKKAPLPDNELLPNLGLYLNSKNLSRILFFYEIYKKIIATHGVIVEFGVRWGQTLSLLSALRGIFEPFNRHRKIIGFDTFKGLKNISKKDGLRHKCKDGYFSVTPDYEQYLNKILSLQEKLNPISHIRRFELVRGDAVKTVPRYFKEHPETMVSLAIFDFDIYSPTKTALESIKPQLFKGSILVFDELCDTVFPGETVALKEVFGLNNVRVQRMPMTSRISYVQIK
jgi:hypothetical protein